MQKSPRYTFADRIRFSEVDHTKKITLPGIVNYFQDCSTFQSEELGLGIDHCKELKKAWILSSWQVVVERYPELGEEISVSTWATGFNGLFGDRNFCMCDKDQKKIAYANSLWVYMDMKKGRPSRPAAEEIEPYGKSEPLEMEYASRKITLPEKTEDRGAFPVRRYHIDTNEHVNNCQYVQMAMELLPPDSKIRQLRVEYKKSAVYGDIIYPKVACEEDRMIVELCDETGKPYAIEEFR
ncbi:acyl-[acyl-carrier-protein] thioesterase [Faecalicatena contorta]|uniref:acyl-[acyl-carrier-protein] thioesterase n=1 Tax=Faecalicatena contorta TaxID=39482 RepID=UPI001F4768BA|nr:acyl-ACP thioesterase domain-containing protein [Faecalicatena contorta]MCF2682658.1 acyl-[acyl-carrier-protein] thioesterase [Faecalicatena contorta]